MDKDKISVGELAALCAVNKETIRRWRKDGVRGVYLEAQEAASEQEKMTPAGLRPRTNKAGVQGKPIYFTREAVSRFAQANPKIMTEALSKALSMEPEEATQGQLPVSEGQKEPVQETQTVRMLRERQKLLEQELAQIRKMLHQLDGG